MNFSWIEAAIVAAIVVILAIIGWNGLVESKRPNMTLKKDDWQCTKSETRTRLQPMGKALIPMTEQVCVEYRRIGG